MVFRTIIVSLFIVLGFASCKPKCHDKTNPDCEDYDPCDGKTRINPSFRVRPGERGFKPPEQWYDLIPCDTFNASSVQFDAPLNNPSNSAYYWQIGTEQTPRTGKGFEIDFTRYLNSGLRPRIPIDYYQELPCGDYTMKFTLKNKCNGNTTIYQENTKYRCDYI